MKPGARPGDLTKDAAFNGRVVLYQHRGGYRFSIDAVLLAHFVSPGKSLRVADLGTGCGVIPLLLHQKRPDAVIFGVEIQPEMAALAERNVAENSAEEAVRILCMDLKALKPDDLGGPVYRVVSNPPYRPVDSGRINPTGQKALARHEIAANLADVADAARRVLKKPGRLAVVYPAVRLADLIHELRQHRLEPKRMRMVHSRMDGGARLALVEAATGGGVSLSVEPPLAIYGPDGEYTREAAAILQGGESF